MEAQRIYREEQKYIESNRETLDKLLEQEQEAMMAQGPSSLFEVFTQAKKPLPPPEESEKKLDAELEDPTKKA
jgi:import inner membrane translocase subunit TIM50